MDQVEEPFRNLFYEKVTEKEKNFRKLYNAFKETCYELQFPRNDVQLYSIIVETFSGGLYLRLYYHLILDRNNEKTDTSASIILTIRPESEEDREHLRIKRTFEVSLDFNKAFQEIENSDFYEGLLDVNVKHYF